MKTLLALLVIVLTSSTAPAHAGQIEDADREVKHNYLTYAEPIGSVRFPNRHYFEMRDGSTYIHVTYGSCARANLVSNAVCESVFWYAR